MFARCLPLSYCALLLCLSGSAAGQDSAAAARETLAPQTLPHPASAPLAPATGLPTRILHEPSGIVFVLIPAGEFEMGAPDGINLERRHRRVICRPFYFAETETTVGQFRKFVDATNYKTDAERGVPDHPDKTVGAFVQETEIHKRDWNPAAQWRNPFPKFPDYTPADDHPVVQISWNDARAFCKHFGLALPTEFQWEYGCRADSSTKYPWGNEADEIRGRSNVADASTRRRLTGESGFFDFDDGYPLLAPVRANQPNAFQLYEMYGNVEEWCAHDFNVPLPEDGADESAPAPKSGEARALRGESWFSGPEASGGTARFGMLPHHRRDFIGFRVCLNLPAEGDKGSDASGESDQ